MQFFLKSKSLRNIYSNNVLQYSLLPFNNFTSVLSEIIAGGKDISSSSQKPL